ncbi:mannose-specific lectin-like [Protopterus annectens]|uniref:mannose-specific lectin-like n=1 Tax=Protopterus annectens TaxID=7888 RepID=UPI001CFB0809|nr:mannose-specific lectin-like [Protopterus annectens]XP_043913861.1 mannose-specific lectin-like [Protopterus annectens]
MSCLVNCFLFCLLIAQGMCTDRLLANGHLNKGQSLVSINGFYRAVFQNDGNFVIYDVNDKALWSTKTAGQVDADKVILQFDNNLVMYTYGGKALWSSQTAKPYGSECVLVMQNDGNLVLYRTSCAMTPIDAIWASRTGQK